ncbi:MAG TPA: hypothetical protein VGO40_05160 [Longimicrobium sp.]|jgi:hypothetical protein|nr:hypothetical protein [Longimicrobium sp.]
MRSTLRSIGRRPAARARAAAICLLGLVAGCAGDPTLPHADVAGLWVQYDQNGAAPFSVWLYPQGDSVPGAASWIQDGVSTEYQVVGRLNGSTISLEFYFSHSRQFTYIAAVGGSRMEGTLRFTDPATPPRAVVLQRVDGGAGFRGGE